MEEKKQKICKFSANINLICTMHMVADDQQGTEEPYIMNHIYS